MAKLVPRKKKQQKGFGVVLLKRTKMRYVTFVGDGDLSAFTAVRNSNKGKGPYEDAVVVKLECVNHVCKLFGS